MTTLLLSNPPGRNRKGQFTKGRKRSTAKRRRSTTKRRRRATATTARRRTTRANPPRRRRRATTARRGYALRDLLPQTAAGVTGYLITDWGTRRAIAMLPADVSGRIPAQAGPLVKGGVAIALGAIARSRPMPASVKRMAPMIVAGGMISAGLDAWAMLRPRLMSGYSNPGMSGYSGPRANGYNPMQLEGRQRSPQYVEEWEAIEV